MDKNILAKVGDTVITKEHMTAILKTIPPQQLGQFSTPEGRKSLINEMVTRELFYLDAKEQKMDEDAEYLDVLEETKHNLLQQFAIQKLLGNITVTDEEMTEYYEKNKEAFKSQEQVNAKHILVKEEEEARNIADEIKQGLSFEEAAKKYSTCPSAQAGGELGLFERGKMVPEFEEAAFNLEVGELSHIVKTQFGFHLITVTEKKAADFKSFEEVKGQIKQYIQRQKQTVEYTQYAEKLKGKYEVEINEEA